MPVLDDQLESDRTRQFQEFLDDRVSHLEIIFADFQGVYADGIKTMLDRKAKRLIVSLDDLRRHNRELCDGYPSPFTSTNISVLNEPTDFLPPFDRALKETALALRGTQHTYINDDTVFYVGFKGSFGDNHVNPRTLRAEHLGKMISIDGIVTRCSLVRPKMVKSIHYCEETKMHHQMQYRDATSLGTLAPTGSTYPEEDGNGNKLSIEFGYSTYRDHQTISIQEMPERAPAGQLPRSVDVIMDDDLVDKVKPGDRVQLVGTYRSLGNRNASSSSSTFRTLILANNVVLLASKAGGGIAEETITDSDLRNIRRLAKDKDVFNLLARSLAPSIFGHDEIKKAILLLLLGGSEKNLKDNGTHIRGYFPSDSRTDAVTLTF